MIVNQDHTRSNSSTEGQGGGRKRMGGRGGEGERGRGGEREERGERKDPVSKQNKTKMLYWQWKQMISKLLWLLARLNIYSKGFTLDFDSYPFVTFVS
jgi:hypothetical protein